MKQLRGHTGTQTPPETETITTMWYTRRRLRYRKGYGLSQIILYRTATITKKAMMMILNNNDEDKERIFYDSIHFK